MMLRTGALVDGLHDAGTNPVSLLVIPTDEELEMARRAAQEIQACE
jgi:acetate kinase